MGIISLQDTQKGSPISHKKSLKILKRVFRIGISKKNRQHNGQKEKDKRTRNYLQHTHIQLIIPS